MDMNKYKPDIEKRLRIPTLGSKHFSHFLRLMQINPKEGNAFDHPVADR